MLKNEDIIVNGSKFILKKGVIFIPSIDEEKVIICNDSCPLNGECYPLYYRRSNFFCSKEGSFIEQFKDNVVCENNLECSSNTCENNKCVTLNIFQKMIYWFKNLFE